ncbi:ATP-grasp peptide maturase system methyltransferase [Actinopolymorpha alba]|uniref:ATP-grasp peptide maturase system methyltransferase n=1 Tax=Actinopolymorpha alba TaxID=533267 RepID=UPI00036E309E|nr:ATP-grasp peptide maturase system methyltransferase [Actinopolymorpha alba]
MTTNISDVEAQGAQLRLALADRLARSGDLRSPAWRAAVEAVPRHLFVPAFFRYRDDGSYLWEPVTAERCGAAAWLDAAYSDDSLVTQLDGKVAPTDVDEPVQGTPTSSATMPSLVVRMWERLQVEDGMRVAEIGTGTGYSTALGCARLGSEYVTSIEVDAEVSARARTALRTAGFEPRLVVGDALDSLDSLGSLESGGRRYDRVIATCSVRTLPYAWVAAARPGALILATLSGWLDAYGMVRLRVGDDGTASGSFVEPTSFMLARRHERPGVPTFSTDLDLQARAAVVNARILDEPISRFVAQLAAPNAQYARAVAADDSPGADYFIDVSSGSYAVLDEAPDGTTRVRQGGPVRLWDAVEEAVAGWRRAGSPGIDAFSLHVTPDGQTVSLATADGSVTWQPPT